MDEKVSPAAVDSPEPSTDREPEVVALQPLAVVDHLCSVTEDQLKTVLAQEEIGGSRRISQQQVQDMLAQIGEFHSKAGGSNANTIRGKSYALQCFGLTFSLLMFCILSSRLGGRLWGPV